MYEKHWELDDKPFRNTPDPHYLFFSRQHEEALTRMLYAITEGQGAMMLTGDYGCGKTLLTRTLLDELSPEKYEVALIPYPNLTALELLREILDQFGYDAQAFDKVQLLRTLSHCLEEHNARGVGTIVIIDEAQMVADVETMEELRLLLNFQQDRKFYLSLILLGQPELRTLVDQMPQLRQRMSICYHISSFSEEESIAYIGHRMKIAGGKHEIFTREAEQLIAAASEGIPRRMNNLADLALLVGYGQKAPAVDGSIVRQVVADQEI